MREWQARNCFGLDELERQPQRGLRMRQFVRSTTIRGRGVSNVDAANHEAPNPKGPFTSFNQGADGSVDNFKRRRATELKHGRIAPWRDPQVQLFRPLGLAGSGCEGLQPHRWKLWVSGLEDGRDTWMITGVQRANVLQCNSA